MSDGSPPDRSGGAGPAGPTAPDGVEISLNGEGRRVPHDCTVGDLVADLGLEARRVAVAVNRQIVARGEFADRRLAAGDRVEILRAVGGGT